MLPSPSLCVGIELGRSTSFTVGGNLGFGGRPGFRFGKLIAGGNGALFEGGIDARGLLRGERCGRKFAFGAAQDSSDGFSLGGKLRVPDTPGRIS